MILGVVYILSHTHTHTHTHIYIYIYIYREREREKGKLINKTLPKQYFNKKKKNKKTKAFICHNHFVIKEITLSYIFSQFSLIVDQFIIIGFLLGVRKLKLWDWNISTQSLIPWVYTIPDHSLILIIVVDHRGLVQVLIWHESNGQCKDSSLEDKLEISLSFVFFNHVYQSESIFLK